MNLVGTDHRPGPLDTWRVFPIVPRGNQLRADVLWYLMLVLQLPERSHTFWRKRGCLRNGGTTNYGSPLNKATPEKGNPKKELPMWLDGVHDSNRKLPQEVG